MNLEALERQAGAAEGLLKAVANRRRLTILCELSRGERSVSELGEAIGLSQSALSQHLARLRADRIVATRRESQTIYYSLESERVRKLIDLLYQLYCAQNAASNRSGKRRGTEAMTIDKAVMAFAGTMVLVSLALSLWLSPYWLLLTAFVGLNLLQASFTGFCPLAIALRAGRRAGRLRVRLKRGASARARSRLTVGALLTARFCV